MKLANCEVIVEQKVHFKLYLPNQKVISVKSKYTKIISDILRTILLRYEYTLEQVKVTVDWNLVNLAFPVTSIDGRRVVVQLIEGN